MPITWKNVNDNFSSQINNLNATATQSFNSAIKGVSGIVDTFTNREKVKQADLVNSNNIALSNLIASATSTEGLTQDALNTQYGAGNYDANKLIGIQNTIDTNNSNNTFDTILGSLNSTSDRINPSVLDFTGLNSTDLGSIQKLLSTHNTQADSISAKGFVNQVSPDNLRMDGSYTQGLYNSDSFKNMSLSAQEFAKNAISAKRVKFEKLNVEDTSKLNNLTSSITDEITALQQQISSKKQNAVKESNYDPTIQSMNKNDVNSLIATNKLEDNASTVLELYSQLKAKAKVNGGSVTNDDLLVALGTMSTNNGKLTRDSFAMAKAVKSFSASKIQEQARKTEYLRLISDIQNTDGKSLSELQSMKANLSTELVKSKYTGELTPYGQKVKDRKKANIQAQRKAKITLEKAQKAKNLKTKQDAIDETALKIKQENANKLKIDKTKAQLFNDAIFVANGTKPKVIQPNSAGEINKINIEINNLKKPIRPKEANIESRNIIALREYTQKYSKYAVKMKKLKDRLKRIHWHNNKDKVLTASKLFGKG